MNNACDAAIFEIKYENFWKKAQRAPGTGHRAPDTEQTHMRAYENGRRRQF